MSPVYNYAILATTNVDCVFSGQTLAADAYQLLVAPTGDYTFTLKSGGTLTLTNPPVIPEPVAMPFTKVVFPAGAQIVALHQ